LIGKAEPFRKDSGKAAPENLFKKQEVVLLLHRERRDTEKTQSMKNRLQVMKFGGTSVGDVECIRRAADIVVRAARETSVVVVVSAMSGVTNRLIDAARHAADGKASVVDDLSISLREQHVAAANVLVSNEADRAQLIVELERIINEVAKPVPGNFVAA
jgi:aspartokinase